MLLGLAALLLVPPIPLLVPVLPVAAPVEQPMLLLVPAFAACALVGWWLGGRLAPALLWLALAVWVLVQPVPGATEVGMLVRGWGALLAGVFGVLCMLRPRRAFLEQALPAVGITFALALVTLVAAGASPAARLERLLLGEFERRTAEWSVMFQQFRDSAPAGAESQRAAAAEVTEQVQARLAELPELSVQLLPALLALESLAALAVAWALLQRLLRMRIGPPLAPLRDFRFNDQLIWGLIVGITTLVVPALAEVRTAGLNLLVFFGALYVVRGLGVLSGLLAPKRWTKVLLVAVGILAWPVLAAFALALGVGDTWLDWRSRARPTT